MKRLTSVLLALVMVVGLLPLGQVAYAATNITSASFSLTGAEIGQNASAVSVSTSTPGLTIVDTYLSREHTSGSAPATGILEPGRYDLQIFVNAQSGYDVSGLAKENITINGKPASSLSNPWNYTPSSRIMIVYRFELGDGSPVFLNESFEQGTVGIPYYELFSFSGNDPISVSCEGTLPPGLSIVGNSIKGKPTTAGTYNFKLKAQNSIGSASKDFSITIVPYTGDTLVSEIKFSVSGINVGDTISNASVTTTTSGVHIIKSEWKTSDTTFSEGNYPLVIWLRPQSGYSFAALEKDVITVNGEPVYQYDYSYYDPDASAWRTRVVAYVSVGGTSSTDVYISAFSFDEGKGTVTGSGKYSKGQSVTITATPKDGYEFDYWTDDSDGTVVTGAGASYTFKVAKSATYVAHFRESQKLVTISASSEDTAKGTVSGSGNYYTGAQATITATPKDGYEFDYWTDDSDGTVVTGAGASYTFKVTKNATYVAHFKNASEVAIDSITITTPPTKTTYTAGESFDPAGMVVTATYSDSTTAPVTGYTVTPSGALTTSDTSVTVSYTEGSVTKTATQAITVNPATSGVLTNVIATITLPTAGNTPVRTGTVDNTTEVTVKDVKFFSNDDSAWKEDGWEFRAGESLMIVVSFEPGEKVDDSTNVTVNGYNATYRLWDYKFDYTVPSSSTKTLSSIAITTPPTKTTYTAGQSFDNTGMVVTATYDDSSTADVTGYTVSPSGALATTDTSVTVSYTEGGVTKTAAQAITVNAASTPTAPTITTSTLPNGKVGTAYEQTLAATGDTPITWTLESGGSLPAGLTLGTDGKISGTPTTAGDYTFTVKASNTAGSDTKSFTVTIASADATTYTVSFNANSGGGTMADVTGISGEYTLPANGFTAPEGKQFKAWSVNGSEKAVGDKITVNANTTVTAIWEAIEYNVTVTGGTASVGAGTPITKATMGTTVTLTAGAAPSGQMFDKWVVNGVVVADANSATTTFTMPANNVTAQATYKDIPVVTYTVSFDANGGTGNMADATGISGEYTLPANGFTAPEGKQFKAWSVNGSEKAVGDKITVTANTTVTAVWEDIPAGHTCDIKPVAKVEPSCTEGGKEAYYKCEGCGKFYEDALGAKEITDLAAWGNIAKNGHTESDWKSDKDNHWKECTVAACGVIIENSKAAHKDDNNDGKCDVCEYNIGTANKPSDDVQSPQTGDNSNMFLWIALLFVSGFGVVATTIIGKRKYSVK